MDYQVKQTAERIKELRLVFKKTVEEMAEITGVTVEDYNLCESGEHDFSFTFLHKCALAFGVDIKDLITGEEAKLSRYTVVKNGDGEIIERRSGFKYNQLASDFRHKLSEPFLVHAPYATGNEDADIMLSTHAGEEFDYVVRGSLKVNINGNEEILRAGDSIYYNSSTPHGMVAVGGEDCDFLAMVVKASGESTPVPAPKKSVSAFKRHEIENPIYKKYIDVVESDEGVLEKISFKNAENFNFAFDIVDAVAQKSPDKLAMIHIDNDGNERNFTFADMSRLSNKAANYFESIGIKRGDRVMLVLKRHYQFWVSILALHKIGAIVIPATNQLLKKDFEYRFTTAGVKAIVCTTDGNVADEVDAAVATTNTVEIKVSVRGKRDGWLDFDAEYEKFSEEYTRVPQSSSDIMLMYFSSGTTGYPKIAAHSFTYALGHFITARYWHNVNPNGVHFTISDTGWGKSVWGKLYGQWICESCVFTYDFDRFDANRILPMFKKYNITTFCAPPTMYRFFIKEDLSKFDLTSLEHVTIAGEALNPEVFNKFYEATGLKLMEGFGQTETTLAVANLVGMEPKPGSMGRPSPLYDIDIIDPDGNPVKDGEVGEIVIRTDKEIPFGLYKEYYNDPDNTAKAWHDGIYHTGDTAWRDEDGYFWYVGRTDDLIKSSGYRIGPFEIESVIMELPYVLECAITAVPDEIRGQVVKATIVLVKDKVGDDDLKKEIQTYVKNRTAPYKYPRIVDFVTELPKTISGKIKRAEIRKTDSEK